MKPVLSLLLAVTLILTLMAVPPAGAQEDSPSSPLSNQAQKAKTVRSDPPGELIIADVLIMRPLGMVACVVGLVGAAVAWPFAAITNSCDRVCNQLIIKPYQYTFERPLGQMDYGDPDFPPYDMGG